MSRIRRRGVSPGARLSCDRVVHLPLLSGPNCPGVPCDSDGFVLVDDAFRVRDDDDVFAVGDATAGPYKQGGLAAQQADVVAEQIAWELGAEHPPRPYRPVLAASCGRPKAPATCAPIRPGNPRRPRSPKSACGGRPARSPRAG